MSALYFHFNEGGGGSQKKNIEDIALANVGLQLPDYELQIVKKNLSILGGSDLINYIEHLIRGGEELNPNFLESKIDELSEALREIFFRTRGRGRSEKEGYYRTFLNLLKNYIFLIFERKIPSNREIQMKRLEEIWKEAEKVIEERIGEWEPSSKKESMSEVIYKTLRFEIWEGFLRGFVFSDSYWEKSTSDPYTKAARLSQEGVLSLGEIMEKVVKLYKRIIYDENSYYDIPQYIFDESFLKFKNEIMDELKKTRLLTPEMALKRGDLVLKHLEKRLKIRNE
ncbi:MAG: hypothetical protein KatS3mg098_474 [Candidatus Parcubacteria bacterium]|nr:hypothetical protein [Patescibacteria group bacterium]BCX16245.1 MAG: hypothetical protein KatS3mg098_474 [Candidatus Parcubacteria bacterium]